MANSDSPSGFTLVGTIGGSAYNAQIHKYAIPAADGTATFVGDAVKTNGDATADGVPYVIQAAATNTIRGIIVGFEPNPSNLELQYRAASTLRICWVCDDPYAVFEIQEDGTMAATDVSGNADIVVAAGSTTSGRSAMELASSTVATGDTLRILELVQRADNEIGLNAKWKVMIMEHELTTGLAGT